MTGPTTTGTGDSEMAAPTTADEAAPFDPDGGFSELEPSDATGAVDEGDDVVRTTTRRRPRTVVALLAAILVVATAQLVISWFVLSTTTQVRDQAAVANGLQRCLISAQLAQLSTQDSAAYAKAVQACLNK